MAIMSCLFGIGIVFGSISGNPGTQNVENFTETALALGAAILSPPEAFRAKYFVATSVLRLPDGSDPYLECTQANPGLCVVSPEWLSACQAEQREVQPGPYLLGPFTGIKVSITNFGAKERDVVVQQLKQGSANYSPELYRTTTHLVGNRPGGNKFIHAQGWGLFIVHHDWVVDSLKAGRRLDERPYHLETYTTKDATSAGVATTGDGQRQPSRTVSSALGAVPCHSGGGDGAGATGVSVPVKQATASIRGIVVPGPPDPMTGTAALIGGNAALRPINSLAQPGTTAAAAAAAAAAPSLPGRRAQPAAQFFNIPAVPPDDCYFLHWVRFWAVGCTSEELSHVLTAVRESGATREPMLHAGVTHIVLGSVLSAADLGEVRQHLSEHREQVRLARLSWLFECVHRRSHVEPEGPYSFSAALLTQGGSMGAAQLQPAQSGRLGLRSRETSPALTLGGTTTLAVTAGAATAVGAARLAPPLDDFVPLDPEANNRTMDSVTFRSAGPGVFAGLWFTLVAVAGTDDESASTKLVRQGGGMIMSASTEKSVREQQRYAVCPFSLPQAAVDRICSNRGRERGLCEFEKVPLDQRVTVSWLHACLARNELLPVRRETPLFRPLPHALPLPRFQNVVVAVSQYHTEQREVLEQLITRLGGTFTEKLNKRCHYLVIPEAQGDKFTHAMKWGIPCVRADWVLESAYAGRPLDDQLIAFLPAGITPAEMEERRAAAAAAARSRGGGGGFGLSQLGPTQRPMQSQLGPTQRPLPLQVSQLPATLPMRGPQGSTQADVRPAAAPNGLPPRPNQALDRQGGPGQAVTGLQAPPAQATFLGNSGHAPMGPPAAVPSVVRPEAPAPVPATKPPSVLKPLINAILGDDVGDTEGVATGAPDTRGAADTSQGQLSGNVARGERNLSHAGTGAAAPAPSAGGWGSDGPGADGAAGTDSVANRASGAEAPVCGVPRAQPAAEQSEQQAAGRPQELDGAAAMLMQFLEENNNVLPEMACSQLDLPMQLPIPLPPLGAAEGSMPGAGGSSMSSREHGSSALSLKTTDGEGNGVGGGVGGRRSRKRAAAAAVGEAQAAPAKVGGLPGRRGRCDDEDDALGLGMSQQVSYEAVAAAPPPRTTRSASRARGQGAADAKANLIKAVQGNIR